MACNTHVCAYLCLRVKACYVQHCYSIVIEVNHSRVQPPETFDSFQLTNMKYMCKL